MSQVVKEDEKIPVSLVNNGGEQGQYKLQGGQQVLKNERKGMYTVDEEKQYFSIQFDDLSHSCVKGNCNFMISNDQLEDRGYDEFQKHPFEPMAKYIRNKSYDNPSQVRTPEALDQSLTYLKSNFLVSILNDQKKIKKLLCGNIRKEKSQELNESKEDKLKQKRLKKILNLIQKQSNLKLIQDHGSFTQNTQNKIIFDSKLETLLVKNQIKNEFCDFYLPEKILVFLQSRLAAIRCELFAQGIVFPRLTMDLIKCQIFLYTLRQNEYTKVGDDLNSHRELKLTGLDVILDQNLKEILLSRQDFSQYYKEALTIAILRTNKRDLMKLIEQHELVLQNEELLGLLKLRLDIQRGNYQKYFFTLSTSTSILVQCMLLTHLQKMRNKLCDVLKSAKIDVKKGWIGILLGLKIKPEQSSEIINLSKNKEYLNEKQEKKEIELRQKQLKNWLKFEDLFYELILNQNALQEEGQKTKNLSIETFLQESMEQPKDIQEKSSSDEQ